MKLDRQNVLEATRQGLQLYAYILRQYYPSETLYLQDQHCRLTRNPFNHHRRTLSISLSEGVARHRDLEWPDFVGDAFDFAALHLKCATEEELLYLINQGLSLGLKVAAEDELEWLEGKDDTWVPRVSFFPAPISNIHPTRQLSMLDLFELITGPEYQELTAELRSLKDKSKARKFKASRLAYVTFAGTFGRRNDKQLEHPSQLLVIDLDNLEHLEEVKHALLADRFLETELLFTSPSGNGLKWVIRRAPGSRHHDYFKAIAHYLKRTYGLDADPSGSDLSRACFLAFDPSAFLHERHRGIKSDDQRPETGN